MKSSSTRWLAFARFSLTVLLVLAGTAHITNTFMLKWAFSDGDAQAHVKSLQAIEAGTAERPYVFRSTLIRGVGAGIDRLSPGQQTLLYEKLTRRGNVRHKFFHGVSDAQWTQRVVLLYFAAYGLTILLTAAYLSSCYGLARHLPRVWGNDSADQTDSHRTGLLAVAFCSLLTPYVFSRWGHFYDFADLCLLFVTFLTFVKRRLVLAALTFVLACLNKETAFIFALFLLPLAKRLRIHPAWLIGGAAVGFAMRTLLLQQWAHNAGTDAQINLLGNVLFWLNPLHRLEFAALLGPGVPTPHASNVLVLTPLIYYLIQGQQRLPRDYRLFVTGSVVSASLLILSVGFLDELRAASTAFPAVFCALLAAGTATSASRATTST